MTEGADREGTEPLLAPSNNNIFKGLAARQYCDPLNCRAGLAPPAPRSFLAIQIMEIISTYVHLNKYHSAVIIERPYGAVQLFSLVCSRFAWENGV